MATQPLEKQLPETSADDEVQIFDTNEAVKKRDHISGRVDMGKSPNSFIAVFKTPPRGGETHIHQHPDSDQVLYVLKGEITVEGLSGKYKLTQQQGVLIPADAMMAKGIGRHIYVFALDRTTIGISTLLLGEWNDASLLRMNCQFEQEGDTIIANLPERLVRWYKINSLSEADYKLIRDPDGTRVRLDLGPLIKREGV